MPAKRLVSTISLERIVQSILLIRGHRVILDADLAELYGVPTKVLNQAVRRNANRFPSDFVFRVIPKEAAIMRSQFVTASKRNIRFRPFAFTEHGTLMAAMVLNSPRAVEMSVQVVRAFVRLREMLVANAQLAHKLAELERKLEGHDQAIHNLFEAIRQLLNPPETKRRHIGFHGTR